VVKQYSEMMLEPVDSYRQTLVLQNPPQMSI